MSEDGYQQSVDEVIARLEEADRFDGFVFAAQAGEQVTTTQGVNPETNVPNAENLLGVLLFSMAQDLEVHPAVLAHSATAWAVKRAKSDDPAVYRDHDEGA